MRTIIDRLAETHTLTTPLLLSLLTQLSSEEEEYLFMRAREVTRQHYGRKIFLRGLIEISNHCRNNCYYCGIRCSNGELERYRLSKEDILACCREGYALGFRTFVMQGGEDPRQTTPWVADVVRSIRRQYPDCAITLSLGEKSHDEYALLYAAGANRYLLRHETYNEAHYQQLHPHQMSHNERIACLHSLKEIGFQTGTGVMVGSPGQRAEHLVEDLLFMAELRPEMIGIGPFLPHHATPFAHETAGSLSTTLRMVAICRLLLPTALIPATTALATLHPQGRASGILAGANVVMPNLSPSQHRTSYSLYDGKAAFGAEAAEGVRSLTAEIATIGYEVSMERGDHLAHPPI